MSKDTALAEFDKQLSITTKLVTLQEELGEVNDEVRNRRNALVINKINNLIESIDDLIKEIEGEEE